MNSEKNPASSIGERIKFAREKLNNISQTELAKRAGISQSFIGALESSNQRNSKYIPEIANALGVSAYWIKTGKDDQSKIDHGNLHDATKEDKKLFSLLLRIPQDERNAMMKMLEIRFDATDQHHQNATIKFTKTTK